MRDDHLQSLDLTGYPIPDDFLLELGRLAALWASLESAFDIYLGKLAGFDSLTDPRPFILLKHSSFPQKLDGLLALCEQLGPQYPNLSGAKDTVAKLRAAQTARNRYLHNGMAPGADGSMQIAIGSARGTLKTIVQPVRVVDIRRASVAVNEAMRAIHALVTGHHLPSPFEASN